MTERINRSDETWESAVFAALSEWYVQAQFNDPVSPTAVVEILASADGVAPYEAILGITAGTVPPFKRLAAMPFVKLRLRGNGKGGLVKVWSST